MIASRACRPKDIMHPQLGSWKVSRNYPYRTHAAINNRASSLESSKMSNTHDAFSFITQPAKIRAPGVTIMTGVAKPPSSIMDTTRVRTQGLSVMTPEMDHSAKILDVSKYQIVTARFLVWRVVLPTRSRPYRCGPSESPAQGILN